MKVIESVYARKHFFFLVSSYTDSFVSERVPDDLCDDVLVGEDGHVIDAWPAGSVDKLLLLADPTTPTFQRPNWDGAVSVAGNFVRLVVCSGKMEKRR